MSEIDYRDYLLCHLDDIYLALLESGRYDDMTEQELETIFPEVTVYPVMHDKAFGGHEEGGWWFDTYQVINDRKDRPFKMMRADLAIDYCRKIADKLEAINDGRRPISSVLSEGRLEYHWTIGEPVDQPQIRPHYE